MLWICYAYLVLLTVLNLYPENNYRKFLTLIFPEICFNSWLGCLSHLQLEDAIAGETIFICVLFLVCNMMTSYTQRVNSSCLSSQRVHWWIVTLHVTTGKESAQTVITSNEMWGIINRNYFWQLLNTISCTSSAEKHSQGGTQGQWAAWNEAVHV